MGREDAKRKGSVLEKVLLENRTREGRRCGMEGRRVGQRHGSRIGSVQFYYTSVDD